MTKLYYIIIPRQGNPRVVTRLGRDTPKRDEIAYRLKLNYPPGWGSVSARALSIDLPEPPTVESIEP